MLNASYSTDCAVVCSTIDSGGDAECSVVVDSHAVLKACDDAIDGFVIEEETTFDEGNATTQEEIKPSSTRARKHWRSCLPFLLLGIAAIGFSVGLAVIVRIANSDTDSTANSCTFTCHEGMLSVSSGCNRDVTKLYEKLQPELAAIGALSTATERDMHSCSPANRAVWRMALEQSQQEPSTTSTPANSTASTALKNRHVLCTLLASTAADDIDALEALEHDVCLHPGVICHDNQEIFFLDLSHENLQGSIPSQLALLTSLRVLQLNDNLLTGTIPSSMFDNMHHLKTLQLSNNNISGEIPSSLFRIARLETIELGNNRFQGQLQTSSVPSSINLIKLDVSHNQLTGPLPDFTKCCEHMVYLNAESNLLTEGVSIHDLPIRSLRYLFLKNNFELDLTYLHLHHMLLLEEISLSGNSCPFPPPVTLRYLRHLDVADCNLSGAIPIELWTPALRFANLSHNDFVGDIAWNAIESRTGGRLEVLDLSYNRLTGKVEKEMNTHVLHLQGNANLTLPEDFCNSSNYCHDLCPDDSCND